jgi:hypothetical protein
MIRVGRGCKEHANLDEMSGLQGGVMVMASLYKKGNLNALCSPTSALKKQMLSRLGEELRNFSESRRQRQSYSSRSWGYSHTPSLVCTWFPPNSMASLVRSHLMITANGRRVIQYSLEINVFRQPVSSHRG